MRYLGAIICLALMWAVSTSLSALFPIIIWFHPNRKEYARCIDQMVNAGLFMGEGRESLSSHSWRDQIKPIIRLTDTLIELGHCREANGHEQPVIDFINTSAP